jgi:hypothetical protein
MAANSNSFRLDGKLAVVTGGAGEGLSALHYSLRWHFSSQSQYCF